MAYNNRSGAIQWLIYGLQSDDNSFRHLLVKIAILKFDLEIVGQGHWLQQS